MKSGYEQFRAVIDSTRLCKIWKWYDRETIRIYKFKAPVWDQWILNYQVSSLDNIESEHNTSFIVKTCLTEAPPRLSFILHVLNYQRLRVGYPRDKIFQWNWIWISDPESYQLNDLWQVFIDPERRENAKKVRKLLVDRYNLIEGKFREVAEKNDRPVFGPSSFLTSASARFSLL